MKHDAAFSDFVAARQTHLRRIAYALCGDWHRADDLLQTALTKLYVAWPRIRHEGNEEAYVRQIMVRANIDESRRPWRRERPTEHLPEAAAQGPTSTEERSALFDALQALPEQQRKVVVLRCRCARRPPSSASWRAPSRATAAAAWRPSRRCWPRSGTPERGWGATNCTRTGMASPRRQA